MKPFGHCTACGGERLTEKTIEKVVRGGKHTATVTVSALVCRDCGERLYPAQTVKRLEEIRVRLEREEVQGFQPVGQQFRVA